MNLVVRLRKDLRTLFLSSLFGGFYQLLEWHGSRLPFGVGISGADFLRLGGWLWLRLLGLLFPTCPRRPFSLVSGRLVLFPATFSVSFLSHAYGFSCGLCYARILEHDSSGIVYG